MNGFKSFSFKSRKQEDEPYVIVPVDMTFVEATSDFETNATNEELIDSTLELADTIADAEQVLPENQPIELLSDAKEMVQETTLGNDQAIASNDMPAEEWPIDADMYTLDDAEAVSAEDQPTEVMLIAAAAPQQTELGNDQTMPAEDTPAETWPADAEQNAWDIVGGAEPVWPEDHQSEPMLETIPAPAAQHEDTKASSTEKKAGPERKAHKGRIRFLILGVLATALVAVIAAVSTHYSNLAKAYEQASAYYAEGDYIAASEAFAALGDYEDSAEWYTKAQLWIDAQTKEEAAGKDPDAWDAAAAAYSEVVGPGAADKAQNCRNMATYYRGAQKLAEQPASLDTVKEALEYFQNCGGVLDAEKKIEHCENLKRYYRGVWRIEHHPNSEKYLKQALELLNNCGGVLDADDQIAVCKNCLSYINAKKLMNNKSWAKAAAAFADLAAENFRDSATLQLECQAHADYEEAESLFADGQYYEAFTRYLAIGDTGYEGLPNMQERAKACVQEMPAGGVMYHSDNYTDTCQLTINNKSNPNAYYKLYIGEELVIAAFVREDSEQSIMLPAGTYSMRKCYGETWFGTKDLFGDEGSYFRCTFGGSETFTLESNFAYIISTGEDGTGIGTKSTSRDDM